MMDSGYVGRQVNGTDIQKESVLTSQVTMGLRPILCRRVKTARAVKIMGAIINSQSERISRNDGS